MRLVLAGVAATLAFALAAPVASAALPDAGAVASTASSTTAATTASATSAVTSATSTATSATSAATGVVNSTAGPTVGAVERHAGTAAAPAKETATKAAAPVRDVAAGVQRTAAGKRTAPRVLPSAQGGEPPRGGSLPTPDVGRELGRHRDTIAQALPDLPAAGPVDDLLTTLGTTLRRIAPVDDLLAPVAPLLGGTGLLDQLPDLLAVVSPRGAIPPLTADRLPPNGGVLDAGPAPTGAPPSASGAASVTTASHSFQAASARPPAAEVGGRPVSPPPRTAPAPVAGGAAAVFSGGGLFVPFLGLLVLAALAMPRLMRRLDELPAFVRPEPFLCALERPG